MTTRGMRAAVAAASVLLPSYGFALPPTYTFQAGVGSDDVGPKTDNFYSVAGSVLFSKSLSRNSIVDLLGEVSTFDYSENRILDGEEIYLQGVYSYTPRAGFRVPTYSLGLSHSEEYLSDDIYDASTTTLTLSISYRIDDRISVLGGVKSGERDAVADSDVTGYFANFDYRLNPEWLLYSTLAAGEGAINSRSYCSDAYGPQLYNQNMNSSWNPSWNSSWNSSWNTGYSPNDCDYSNLTLGANYVIDAFNSLDLSVSLREYDTPAGDSSGNVYSVDYFHRF